MLLTKHKNFVKIKANMKSFEELDFDTLSQEDISNILMEYKQLVNQIARRYFLVGGTQDDIVQEGMIGLFKAITTYSKEQNCSFKTFATLCIERSILDAIKSANRQKNIPLNEFFEVTEDGKINFNNTEVNSDKLFYIPANDNSLEDEYINKQQMELLLEEINQKLSKFEQKVFALYIEGISIEVIAQRFNKEVKSIYNAISRIKDKLSYLRNNS